MINERKIMSKVYVTTNTKLPNGGYRDISDCERFGTPIIMFENPKQIQVNSTRFAFAVEKKLKDFTSNDFFIIDGRSCINWNCLCCRCKNDK